MGIASLILGILGFFISFIPFLGIFAFVPALIAFVLGIVDIVKKSKEKQKKGVAIAGLILSIITFISIVVVNVFSTAFFLRNSELFTNSDTSGSIFANSLYNLDDTNHSNEISKKCALGESVTLEDVKVTFASATKDFTGYSKYATVKSGYKVLKADFDFENVGNSTEYVSSLNFDCYADGYSCDKFYSVDDSSFYSNLSSGKKVKGSVYFLVPETAVKISLEYEMNSYTGSKIVFDV